MEDYDIYDDEPLMDYGWDNWRNRKPKAKNNTDHVPNKNEAKTLRMIMSKTGLTEKEVRMHKVYRRMLSNAQKMGSTQKIYWHSKHQRSFNMLMKNVLRDLKLAKEHPRVKEEFMKRLNDPSTSYWMTSLKIWVNHTGYDAFLADYKKKKKTKPQL